MESLKPNHFRSRTAISLIWVVMAADILLMLSGFFQYTLLTEVSGGKTFPMETLVANDLRQRIIAIIYMIVYLVSGITFIQWFRRAYYNLHNRSANLSFSEGWAAGSWFVPILNLFRPYQIMKELYLETDKTLIKNYPGYSWRISTSLLGWWWALWLLNAFLGQLSFRLAILATNVDALVVSTSISILSSLIGISLAVVTVRVIKDYAKIEPLLFRQKDENVHVESHGNIVIKGINY